LMGDSSEPPVLMPFSSTTSRAMRAFAKQECARISSDAQRSSNALLSLGAVVKSKLGDVPTVVDAFTLSVLGEVPDHLWYDIESWQKLGGAEAITLKMRNLDTLAEEAMQVVVETRELLNKEEESAVRFLDSSERAGDQQRIQVCQSAGNALQGLVQRLSKLQQAWEGGRDADEKLRFTLNDESWTKGCLLLAKSRKEIADELRRASKLTAVNVPTNTSAAAAAGEISESLIDGGAEEIPLSSSESWGRVEALKRTVSEVVPLLLKAIAGLTSRVEQREAVAREMLDVTNSNKLVSDVLKSAAGFLSRDLQKKGYGVGAVVNERDAVQQALVPVTLKLSELSGGSFLSESEQANELSKILSLRDKFVEARDTYDEARFAVAVGKHDEAGVKQMQQDYKERSDLVHLILARSKAAWKHLDQGELWYADLMNKMKKVKEEASDHCFAQEMLRADFGQSAAYNEDEEVAQRMQAELESELDQQEFNLQMEQSHQQQIMQPSQQLQQQPQMHHQYPAAQATNQIPMPQESSQRHGDKTQLATKIPQGVGPGGRIKVTFI
jgi:hypothetical protein